MAFKSNYTEKWGVDVDEAVNLALQELKLTRDEVEITVLEEPSKGFLGLGAKLAKVRVESIVKEEEVVEEVKPEKTAPRKPEKKSQKSNSGKPKKDRSRKERKPAAPEIHVTADVKASEKPEGLVPVEEHEALTFLEDVARDMGLNLDIKAEVNETCVYITINGEDAGTIIGKRGQTLDSIQYLTSLVVNKDKEKYIRVIVDAENYREKREVTLEQLANRLAAKVVRTRRSVRLEPMNPYERKVIHATLQNYPEVTTRSEGDEPYRRVVIELK